MNQRQKWLGTWTVPTALTIVLAGWAGLAAVEAQTAPPPGTQPASVPYSMEANAEITKLKPAPSNPKTAEELSAVQARVEAVARQALPATVGLIMADGQGSGVIVSKDGYVLTAGHVSGTPGARLQIRLSNGNTVSARSLGANNGIDSGMVKITTPGNYPYMPMGNASKLETGQWVVAMGHPGGVQDGRPPVVRLGRVLALRKNTRREVDAVYTDCTLINGDSGGPVFDLDGRIIGINSRIGVETTQNIHVPIDTFETTWDRLAASELWGGRGGVFAGGRGGGGGQGRGAANGGGAGAGGTANATPGPNAAPITPAPATPVKAVLGVVAADDSKGPVISWIHVGTPAEMAGLKAGDVITKLNSQLVRTADDLSSLIAKHKPGDVVTLELVRGTASRLVKVTLGSDQ